MSAPPIPDRLARARDYLAIAESGDAKRTAYEAAADEIIAWLKEDSTRALRDVDRLLGRGENYCGRLVRWRTSAAPAPGLPFGGADERVRKDDVAARTVMRERPAVIESALQDAPLPVRAQLAASLLDDPDVRATVARGQTPHQKQAADRQASNREQFDVAMAPFMSTVATLGSIGLLDEVRRLHKLVQWSVEHDAQLPAADVEEARRLVRQIDVEFVVYLNRVGVPVDLTDLAGAE